MSLKRMLYALLLATCLVATAEAKETKDIQFKFANADPVVFSHDVHLNKYNNNCRICHNAIFNLRSRRHFTMAEMEKTKSCGACHTGVKAFSVSDPASCIKCHKGKPRTISYKVKGATEALFSHEVHVSKTGGNCNKCHKNKAFAGKKRGITMAEMAAGKTCGSCHNDKTAFTVSGNCGRCHKGMTPRDITFKIPAGDAQFSHKTHLGKYKCNDCHTKLFAYKAGARHFTMADMEKGNSCGACHNGKTSFASSSDCGKCHKSLKPGIITFKNDGGEVKFSHEFHLGMYACAECHPKRFPFSAGKLKATMEAMEEGKSCGGCHNAKDAFGVKDECGKCHKMGG